MLFATLPNSANRASEIFHLPGCYEPCSSLSHFFGALLFFALGLLLLRRGRGDRFRMTLLGIYVSSCVFLMLMSGSYHMLERGSAARTVMERLDHAAIFVFIAGTCTAAYGLLFHGAMRWFLLFFVWTSSIMAITLKTIYFTNMPEWLGLALYLTFGWFGAFSALHLARRYGFAFIQPLLLGGIAYSIGAVMEYLGWPVLVPGMVHPHEVFHGAVLAGALCHWFFIWQFAPGEVRVVWRLARPSAHRAPQSAALSSSPSPLTLRRTG